MQPSTETNVSATTADTSDALTAAVHDATRALIRVTTPEQAVGVLIGLVRQLGGTVAPARLPEPHALPLDLSFGEGEPLLPVAAPGDPARARLERALPAIVEDARAMLTLLRDVERSRLDAAVDPLTGLLNRRAIAPLLTRLQPGDVVAMLDLDRFKHTNDTRGHEAGDLALRGFSRLLREQLRATDPCARYGGDEFLVLLPRSNRWSASGLFHRLRRRWDEVRPLPIEFSAGLAVVPRDGRGEDALRAADEALYGAKAAGRGRIAWAAPEGEAIA